MWETLSRGRRTEREGNGWGGRRGERCVMHAQDSLCFEARSRLQFKAAVAGRRLRRVIPQPLAASTLVSVHLASAAAPPIRAAAACSLTSRRASARSPCQMAGSAQGQR